MDNDAKDTAEKVTIMTMHAAKGLEFDNVFLPGWEEGVFPSQRSLDEGGLASLEEERRLAYVAITRARRRCTILHAANRRIYGQWVSAIPSRFVEELPEAHIARESTLSGGGSGWGGGQWGSAQGSSQPRTSWGERPATPAPSADWQRPSGGFTPAPRPSAPKASTRFAAQPRLDLRVGDRVDHAKFGPGTIAAQEGNKLEIDFDEAGRKRVLDSFVQRVG